jgi:diguanylate cyclase (GGDEF)-like protein
VTGALLFLAGALVGGIVGWLIALRFAGEARPSVVPPLPDEVAGSDTATHLASSIPAESTFEPLAYVLMERCAASLGMPCALVMREKPGAAAYIAAVAGGLDSRMMSIEVHLDSAAGRALTEGVPVVGAPDEKVIAIDKGDRRRYSGGGIAVPLGQGGQIYGAIVVFGDVRAPREAVELLASEAKKFGPVIIPAYTAAIAARRAETDELTGLSNRRVLTKALGRVNGGERASLLMIDIDHFKSVNDTLGHQAGDAALRHIARLVREAVRPRDTAARIGGEEFAVWLPGADGRTGHEVAERLRASVQGRPFKHQGQDYPITVSIGVASYPSPIKAVDNLMGAADAALYAAKRDGRNKVIVSQAQAG